MNLEIWLSTQQDNVMNCWFINLLIFWVFVTACVSSVSEDLKLV